MFFEAPAGTWAHQDSYYQDSATRLGDAIAGWYALEDIDARAGRFYICPGSHRNMKPLLNEGQYSVAEGHATYQRAILAAIRDCGMTIKAPFLAAGDVLFWSSLTIHGSLPASAPGVSRASLTGHYLQEDDAMLQFHNRIREQGTMVYNGTTVCLLHDQDVLRNRLFRDAAFHFPQLYKTGRRLALRLLLAKQSMQPAVQHKVEV
jgi:phytanoyl-CoA hydroxylase